MVKFFESRDESPQVYDEILKAREVWAAWYTGTTVGTGGAYTKEHGKRLKRVLLIAPDPTGYLGTFEGLFTGISVENLQSSIETTAKRLQLIGVKDLRFLNGTILGMVIFEPNDNKKGRIRLEPMGAHLEAQKRPIIIIEAKRHPKAFKNLVASYDETWSSLDDQATGQTKTS